MLRDRRDRVGARLPPRAPHPPVRSACVLSTPRPPRNAPQAIASACPSLSALSVVGARGLGTAGLRALSGQCRALRRLAAGGARGGFSDWDLSGFRGLEELHVKRRQIPDAALAAALARSPALRELSLAACGAERSEEDALPSAGRLPAAST